MHNNQLVSSRNVQQKQSSELFRDHSFINYPNYLHLSLTVSCLKLFYIFTISIYKTCRIFINLFEKLITINLKSTKHFQENNLREIKHKHKIPKLLSQDITDQTKKS